MKRITFNYIILSCILFMIMANVSNLNFNNKDQTPESARITSNPSNYFGILIGIEDYPGTAMDLVHSAEDVIKIKNMVSSWYAQWTNSFYLTTLADNQVNKTSIENAFATMAARVDSNDVFVFYFSGRGTINPTLSLCPYDTYDSSSPNYNSYYFTTNWLNDLLNSIKGKIMVILDANHSGGFVPHLAYKDRLIIASSQPNEIAKESGFPYSSKIFTYCFTKAFENNYDPNGDGYTSLKEAIDNATAQTTQVAYDLLTIQVPVSNNQIGDNFKPVLFNDRDGDGVADSIEFIQGTSEVDPMDNWRDNVLRLAANILTIIFLIALPIIIILLIYMHNEGYRQIPAAMEPFPPKQKLATPIDKDKVTRFNALTSISQQNKTNVRDPIAFLINKGKPIILTNPRELFLPLRCVITGEDLKSDEIDKFPIQNCIYNYPKASNIPENQQKQWGIKVPISFKAKERMELSQKRNSNVKKFAILSFVVDFALFVLLSLFVHESLASVLFWMVLTVIIIIAIYSIDKIVTIDKYFMAIRLDADRIEIRIRDEDYRQIFKQLNKIE